ncbi:biotin--[acetyl-CoA-carboxylase] ligase [Winogradskyella alexanderae]|uniref:Biotin--[acetyl-CoA-carboxylase] ligase n=1 Tax=Winogradskyella alexanderae TaxID=2877123 RepID=A0ABS7XUG0_9FLAO|nr:biotin--[acetyl-CoA-carboxylase] ligase [Winogradskyella alexanderae]MCA0133670.1 biotin--[acetyl-CoA-carboxylase] ligase [Winogradskyella alexanderae]
MFIIKLNAIDSTNAYIKAMTSKSLPKDFTVAVADFQANGRGQMGTSWDAEAGKNLTVSVFKKIERLKIEQQFYISMCVSLAILDVLRKFQIRQLKIKWPNDILSANKKICGILIENIVKNNKLVGSVIGFGLNINQKNFRTLPHASSLSLLTGILYDKDEVLSEILQQLEYYFTLLEKDGLKKIKDKYHNHLFRMEKPSTFKLQNKERLTGIIKGVEESGKLIVWTEDEVIQTFDLKEIRLLY